MQYKIFGNTGLRVSELCLGTMTFGTSVEWGSDKQSSKKVFSTFLNAGGNFIDTADIYQAGQSEAFLGDFIGQTRHELVLATKYTFSSNLNDPNAGGNQRKNLVQSLEGSLKRLHTDYIDILWVHRYDPFTPIEQLMRSLDDLIKQGKILHIGISNAPTWMIAKANTLADLRGWTTFSGLQAEYSLIERSIEHEQVEMAKHFNMTLTPWSPLSSGILSGKYLKNASDTDRRLDKATFRKISKRDLEISEKLEKIAGQLHTSMSVLALKWLMQKGPNIIPIVGARNEKQLNENLKACELEIPQEYMEQLNEISAPADQYPGSFLERSFTSMMGNKELS